MVNRENMMSCGLEVVWEKVCSGITNVEYFEKNHTELKIHSSSIFFSLLLCYGELWLVLEIARGWSRDEGPAAHCGVTTVVGERARRERCVLLRGQCPSGDQS